MKFGINNSQLTNNIYIGRLNKKGTMFLEKEDMTLDALSATIEHVLAKNKQNIKVSVVNGSKKYTINIIEEPA